jgi:hypothetical protein
MPVAIIGLVTFIVFLLIILFSQARTKEESKLPSLLKISDTSSRETNAFEPMQSGGDVDVNLEGSSLPSTLTQEQAEKTAMTSQEIDALFGVLEIVYTKDGFSPKNVTGYSGQLVRWTNLTDAPIALVQRVDKFDEWMDTEKPIRPGEVFEFRLYKDSLWAYIEKDTQNYGSIYIRMP